MVENSDYSTKKGEPTVSMYEFNEEKLNEISVHRFKSADKEWLKHQMF